MNNSLQVRFTVYFGNLNFQNNYRMGNLHTTSSKSNFFILNLFEEKAIQILQQQLKSRSFVLLAKVNVSKMKKQELIGH